MKVIFRLTGFEVLLCPPPHCGHAACTLGGAQGRVGLGAMEKSHSLTDTLCAHKKGKHVGISGIGGSSGSG